MLYCIKKIFIPFIVCFHGIIPVLMFILVIELNLKIRTDLVTWQYISSAPASARKEWFMFRQKNAMMVLPKLFTPPRMEKPENFLLLWTGLPGW